MRVRTENEQKGSFINVIFWAAIWISLLSYLTGCSLKLEVGYHGETAIEDKTFTADKRK